MADHPLRGCFKFEDLPFEKVIDTKYTLQTKKYVEYNDPDCGFEWVSLCTKDDYESVRDEYDKHWKNLECRMLKMETTVYNIKPEVKNDE